jgi:hypothetical protein
LIAHEQGDRLYAGLWMWMWRKGGIH